MDVFYSVLALCVQRRYRNFLRCNKSQAGPTLVTIQPSDGSLLWLSLTRMYQTGRYLRVEAVARLFEPLINRVFAVNAVLTC